MMQSSAVKLWENASKTRCMIPQRSFFNRENSTRKRCLSAVTNEEIPSKRIKLKMTDRLKFSFPLGQNVEFADEFPVVMDYGQNGKTFSRQNPSVLKKKANSSQKYIRNSFVNTDSGDLFKRGRWKSSRSVWEQVKIFPVFTSLTCINFLTTSRPRMWSKTACRNWSVIMLNLSLSRCQIRTRDSSIAVIDTCRNKSVREWSLNYSNSYKIIVKK